MESENDILRSAETPHVQPQIELLTKKSSFPTLLDIVMLLIILVASQAALVWATGYADVIVEQTNSQTLFDVEQHVNEQTMQGKLRALIYPIYALITLCLSILYMYLRGFRGKPLRYSAKGFNPNIILIGLLWLVAMQVVVEPVSLLLPEAEQSVDRGFWSIIVSVVFVPVFEELFFRGVILESLLKRHRRLFSVIVSSLIFAFMHGQPAIMLTAFVSGLVFGTIYLHTNSVFSTIILHSINNAIAYALMTLNLDGFSYYDILGGGTLYFVVYGVSLVLAGIFTYETWRKRNLS